MARGFFFSLFFLGGGAILIWSDFIFLFWFRALAQCKATLLEGGFFS